MRARLLSRLLLLAALAGPALSPALAQGRGYSPLDRLLPEIRRHTPGTFYDAQGPVPGPDGQLRYHIKWMTPEGRIVWFDVDARNGRVLGMARERYDPAMQPWPQARHNDGDWGHGGNHGGDRSGDHWAGRGRHDDRRGPH